jgi:hypothetical protein
MPLSLNQSKERFSEAYVRAVVAAAGMHVEPRTVDVDSIDGSILYTGELNGVFSPQIGFQLKCTASEAARTTPAEFSFTLPVKNYNELRVSNTTIPRILIIVVVPTEIRDWVIHSDDALLVKRCAYWRSLEGVTPTGNLSSKTVSISKSQSLTVDALKQMMSNVAGGGSP